MHAYGGLYLDLDAECLRNAEEGLAGFNLVLQRERGPASVGTAAMASVPRLPLVSVSRRHMVRHYFNSSITAVSADWRRPPITMTREPGRVWLPESAPLQTSIGSDNLVSTNSA